MPTLGEEIARLRDAKEWTQAELAAAIGHGKPTTVSKYENDKQRPGPPTLAKLAEALGVPFSHWRQFGGAYNRRGPKATKRQREAITKLGLDPLAEAGRMPPHAAPSQGDLSGMLTPDEDALVTTYRLARLRGGEAAANRIRMLANEESTREEGLALPKTRRHSGGNA